MALQEACIPSPPGRICWSSAVTFTGTHQCPQAALVANPPTHTTRSRVALPLPRSDACLARK
ncbi:hypothetical protein P7K49_003534, partial [Saguinus oedipus]